jgi:hypothetical protein
MVGRQNRRRILRVVMAHSMLSRTLDSLALSYHQPSALMTRPDCRHREVQEQGMIYPEWLPVLSLVTTKCGETSVCSPKQNRTIFCSIPQKASTLRVTKVFSHRPWIRGSIIRREELTLSVEVMLC